MKKCERVRKKVCERERDIETNFQKDAVRDSYGFLQLVRNIFHGLGGNRLPTLPTLPVLLFEFTKTIFQSN